jgi:hypothetical protein
MSEHDITLVTAKAGSVIAEGLKLSLATPGGGLTPSTITAMVGISKGEALTMAPEVKAVMAKLEQAKLPTLGNSVVGGVTVPIANPDYHPEAASTLSSLTSLQNKIMPPDNHAAFGSFLSQAQGHINDSIEVQNSMNFISNSNFGDFGSGITNMSSMMDQGLTGSLGSLSGAGAALGGCGKLFDVKDMANFGSPAGLIGQLNANKLGNATGLNAALKSAGVDTNNLSDPVYADKIKQVMGNIKDPEIIQTVATQMEVASDDTGTTTSFVETGTTTYFGGGGGNITSLADFTDVKKVVSPDKLAGFGGNFSDIGKKFGDLGASFASPAAAKNMLGSLEMPQLPKLNAATPSLGSLMGGMGGDVSNMMNGGAVSGIPKMSDIMQVVGGGGAMAGLAKSNDISSIVSGVKSSVGKSTSLLGTAGIDIDSPPKPSLGSAMGFATNLHKFGADTSGSGISDMLKNMANPASKFGESITASLAEGKNRALMQASGIPPLDFSGVPVGEAANNLKQGKFIPGTGGIQAGSAASAILGGQGTG